jgi:hypothetical protein
MKPGFWKQITSYTPGRTYVDLEWTSGSSGAVPTSLTEKSGVKSVTHGSTGAYAVVLEETPYHLTNIIQSIEQASYSKTGACKVELVDTDLDEKLINLLVVDGDGDAVDPTDNDIIRVTFVFRLFQN